MEEGDMGESKKDMWRKGKKETLMKGRRRQGGRELGNKEERKWETWKRERPRHGKSEE